MNELPNPEELVFFLFKQFPWTLLLLWSLYSLFVVFNKNFRSKYSNYYILTSIPNVFVTLGLFGTFTGIAYGLFYFDTNPSVIKESIKILLEGLRMAMFTSIYGIIWSLIFSNIIKIKINSKVIPQSESAELIELRKLNENFYDFKNAISTSHYNALVESLKEVLGNFNEVFLGFINELVEQNFEELTNTIHQLNEWQKNHKDQVESLTSAYVELVSQHNEFVEKTFEWVERLDEISGQSSKLQIVIDEFNEAFNENGNLSLILKEVQKASTELTSAINTTSAIVSEIEETSSLMNNTSKSLSETSNSVQIVTENSQKIFERTQALQTINVNHIDGLVEQFNSSLRGTFATFDALINEYIKDIEKKINK